MRVALFSDKKKFEAIKYYSDIHRKHLRINHTESIKQFFTLLFYHKKISYDYVVIDEKLAGSDFDDLVHCVSSHMPTKKMAILSENFSSEPRIFTFDTSELGLKRWLEHIDTLRLQLVPTVKKSDRFTDSPDDFESMLRRYETIINGAGEAIVGLNENGQITFLNTTACELLARHETDLLGRSLAEFALDSPMNKGVSARSFTDMDCDKRRVGRGVVSKPDGSMIYVEYTQSYVGNRVDDTVSIMVMEDIGDRVKFEAKLKTLANRDPLTGVANRRYFQRALEKELSGNRQNNSPVITALIDIDDFKHINDQYGHAVGDRLLMLTARRLTQHLRRGDLVARLGGDEFILMFKDTSPEDATTVIENVLTRVGLPFTFNEQTIKPSVSIGLCMTQESDHKLDDLLERMDQAMYRVKQSGKGDFAWYKDQFQLDSYNELGEKA